MLQILRSFSGEDFNEPLASNLDLKPRVLIVFLASFSVESARSEISWIMLERSK
jgi:hypothetical protein